MNKLCEFEKQTVIFTSFLCPFCKQVIPCTHPGSSGKRFHTAVSCAFDEDYVIARSMASMILFLRMVLNTGISDTPQLDRSHCPNTSGWIRSACVMPV